MNAIHLSQHICLIQRREQAEQAFLLHTELTGQDDLSPYGGGQQRTAGHHRVIGSRRRICLIYDLASAALAPGADQPCDVILHHRHRRGALPHLNLQRIRQALVNPDFLNIGQLF